MTKAYISNFSNLSQCDTIHLSYTHALAHTYICCIMSLWHVPYIEFYMSSIPHCFPFFLFIGGGVEWFHYLHHCDSLRQHELYTQFWKILNISFFNTIIIGIWIVNPLLIVILSAMIQTIHEFNSWWMAQTP